MEELISCFGLVITTEVHPVFSGARAHSNNTAETSPLIDALSFFGPRGLVARDEQSYIFYDSMHAAGILSMHDPSPFSCAAGARMSTIYDLRPTQATARHAARVWSYRELG